MNNVFIVHGWVLDAIRLIFATIDNIVYGLLTAVVAIFYNVASAQLISGTIMHDFFSRIQLILGIIVMFKVATSLFMGIMNPESVGDNKTGFGSVIKRVIIVLIMLVLIVPLDIPGVDMDDISDEGQTSWNARLNANGIAFGTLFELQARLLKQNTIAKLILGVDGSKSTSAESGLESGQDLSRIIFKSFFTIAEYEGEPICEASSGSNLEKAYDLYLDDDSSSAELLSIVNYTCEDGDGAVMSFFDTVDFLDLFDGGNFYAFSYSFLFSTVVGIFCAIIMISYTVDAAIRLIKLTILYLISPIPILSYIDPKTEKNFQNWLKVVGSTYIDLFIRLAIVYIIIFLIREVNSTIFNGTNDFIGIEDGIVGQFSKVFIILGLLMFAREAPKFITDTLGLKQTSGLFGGLTSLMGGITSGIQGFKTAQDAAAANNQSGAKSTFKSVAAGLINGVDGAGNVYSDYANAKDHKFRTALDKINKQNAIRRANGQEGVTFGQSLMAQARQDFTGSSRYHELQRAKEERDKQIKSNEAALQQAQARNKALGEIVSKIPDRVKSKGAKVTTAGGRTFSLTDMEAAQKYGEQNNIWQVKDTAGNLKTFTSADEFRKAYESLVEQASNEYIRAALGTAGEKTAYYNRTGVSVTEDHMTKLRDAQNVYGANLAGAQSAIGELKSATGKSSDEIAKAQGEIDKLKQGTVKVGNETVDYSELPKEIEKERRILTGSDGTPGKQS